jgi:hypothetical protein
MFTFADSTGEGELTVEDFLRLLNTLHPFDKLRAKRALAELNFTEGQKVSFPYFCQLNDMLPNLFYPGFRLQYQMREKVILLITISVLQYL